MAAQQPSSNFGQETTRLERFIGLLTREQELLTQGETESLIPLIAEKNALLQELSDISRAREEALGQLGMPPGRTGMEAWLAQPGNDALRQEWQFLLELAAKARTLNETNGKLIGLRMQDNQQALAALLGAADLVATYGPDGQQQAGLTGRILGSA